MSSALFTHLVLTIDLIPSSFATEHMDVSHSIIEHSV